MDRDDQRRYFVVGSVILEIVTPLFRQRLENDYKNRGFASFQAFADSKPIIHILFHLRHTNVWCCQDKHNCRSRASLPLNYNQWDLLFKQVNPAIRNHLCHCQYTANPVQLEDLDITLAGLILRNCCNLGPVEEIAIKGLRKFKNNYLSHNTKGCITETEYNIVWSELTRLVLQLDNTKQDDLIRMENRPLDGSLCAKYCLQLLDIHQKLDQINESINCIVKNSDLLPEMNTTLQKIDKSVQENSSLLQRVESKLQINESIQCVLTKSSEMETTLQKLDISAQGNVSSLQRIDSNIQELLFYAKGGATCQCYNTSDKSPYKLGQSVFHLHHQFDITSEHVGTYHEWMDVTDGVMMDDGRLVLYLPSMDSLLTCNTDGSQTDSIPLEYGSTNVTAVNNSTVAVLFTANIEMYDINNKHKLKSIKCPEGQHCRAFTTIDNKLVVRAFKELYIIDHQTGEVIQTIRLADERTIYILCVHATVERIFYSDGITNKLYCYMYSDDKHTATTLSSVPIRITSLQDGSLYVLCIDGTLQHVSSDGKHYELVTTKGLTSMANCIMISYNQKQQKLVTCDLYGPVKLFECLNTQSCLVHERKQVTC